MSSSNGDAETRRFVVTGASRGIGLELCRQLADAGHEVFALARRPGESVGLRNLCEQQEGRVLQHPCDIDNEFSVQDAAAAVDAAWDAVDVLINNAGVFGKRSDTLGDVEIEELRQVFETNAFGTLRVTRAFLPSVLRRAEARPQRAPGVLHVSSRMGSIGDEQDGGRYAYRMSKAALNMMHRTLSVELADRGAWSVAMSPGWVRTDMGGEDARLGVEESVRAILDTLAGFGPGDNGRFVDRDGTTIPW